MSPLTCASEQRREAVRQHARLNGLDYLEVGADRRTLSVHFLGKAPVSLEPPRESRQSCRRHERPAIRDGKLSGR